MGAGAWFPCQQPNLIKQSNTKPAPPFFSRVHITINTPGSEFLSKPSHQSNPAGPEGSDRLPRSVQKGQGGEPSGRRVTASRAFCQFLPIKVRVLGGVRERPKWGDPQKGPRGRCARPAPGEHSPGTASFRAAPGPTFLFCPRPPS